MIRLFSFVGLLSCIALSVYSQETLEPEMIDTFGRLSCDDLNSRSANLAQHIYKTASDTGLVITYVKPGQRELAIRQFRVTLARFEDLKLDSRIHFIIGQKPEGPITEYWRLPAGASETDFIGDVWTFPKPNVNQPFIFDSEDEIGICTTFVPRKFAELLLANPGSRANIVINAGDWGGQYAHFADETIKTLVEKFRVDRKRIRTFYVRQKKKNSMTYAEYWFVPAKRRPAVSK